MKVLLVDDEKYTREGIMENINWRELGVSICAVCEDGRSAYNKARTFIPDILITDVRMPVMDGISLAQKIHEEFPYCKIIFMSGFSDKEYLFAAMRLKAVEYVEKPIRLEELSKAISNAVCEVKKERELHNKYKVLDIVEPMLRSALVMLMIKPNADRESLADKAQMAGLKKLSDLYVITAIVRLYDSHELPVQCQDLLPTLEDKYNVKIFSAAKENETVIVQILKEGCNGFSPEYAAAILNEFSGLLEGSWMIAVGTAELFENAYMSYSNAVINLEYGFYIGNDRIICPVERPLIYTFDGEMINEFEQAFWEKNRDKALELVNHLSIKLKIHTATLVSAAKNYLYRMFMVLEGISEKLSEHGDEKNTDETFRFIMDSHTLDEIIDELKKRIDVLFAHMNLEMENNSVWRIKQYIKRNYSNSLLSIDEIAEYVDHNISYVNLLFRKSEGVTINQYITQYRVSEAEKLLVQSNVPIKDVAVRVGYQNSNYFSKVFKKVKKMLPKEYRRRYMR